MAKNGIVALLNVGGGDVFGRRLGRESLKEDATPSIPLVPIHAAGPAGRPLSCCPVMMRRRRRWRIAMLRGFMGSAEWLSCLLWSH